MDPRLHSAYSEQTDAWDAFFASLSTSIDQLEEDIDEAEAMSGLCRQEWCEATEHVFDELNNALFSISEPRWNPAESSRRIKRLKLRLHDAYARFRSVPGHA